MGLPPVPPYANMFMAKKIDPKFLEIAKRFSKNGQSPMEYLKRFLDDFISFWNGTSKDLHAFFEDINQIHPQIKFTMKHTTSKLESPEDRCECQPLESIPFLDTLLSLRNRKISVDLYRKPTDRNQYLLTNSIHPPECIKNIPYSLALRIIRTCTEKDEREKRLEELRELLIERKYRKSLIDASIRRAKAIPRAQALKYKAQPNIPSKRPIFSVTYDPRLPNLPAMQRKHWRSMTQDQYLESVFPEPPLVAYRRQKNLSDFLIKARLPRNQGPYPTRKLNGMKKCK
jgi:hypothetical protein